MRLTMGVGLLAAGLVLTACGGSPSTGQQGQSRGQSSVPPKSFADPGEQAVAQALSAKLGGSVICPEKVSLENAYTMAALKGVRAPSSGNGGPVYAYACRGVTSSQSYVAFVNSEAKILDFIEAPGILPSG